jgi:hypothetical protein
MGGVVLHGHDQFVPVLGTVLAQILVRPRERIVAALKLRLANEDATVGIRRRAELKLEDKVPGELASTVAARVALPAAW